MGPSLGPIQSLRRRFTEHSPVLGREAPKMREPGEKGTSGHCGVIAIPFPQENPRLIEAELFQVAHRAGIEDRLASVGDGAGA